MESIENIELDGIVVDNFSENLEESLDKNSVAESLKLPLNE